MAESRDLKIWGAVVGGFAQDFRCSGDQEFGSAGIQDFGFRAFGSLGVWDFRSSGNVRYHVTN